MRIAVALVLAALGCVPALAQGVYQQNQFLAGPTSGADFPAPRLIVGGDLPNPSASTLGGVRSLTCAANQWLNTISIAGVPACAQPSFSNLSGANSAAQLAGSAASHAIPVDVAGTPTWKVIPDCPDTNGNHLNYTQSSDTPSCGITTPAQAVPPFAFQILAVTIGAIQ